MITSIEVGKGWEKRVLDNPKTNTNIIIDYNRGGCLTTTLRNAEKGNIILRLTDIGEVLFTLPGGGNTAVTEEIEEKKAEYKDDFDFIDEQLPWYKDRFELIEDIDVIYHRLTEDKYNGASNQRLCRGSQFTPIKLALYTIDYNESPCNNGDIFALSETCAGAYIRIPDEYVFPGGKTFHKVGFVSSDTDSDKFYLYYVNKDGFLERIEVPKTNENVMSLDILKDLAAIHLEWYNKKEVMRLSLSSAVFNSTK